MKFFVLDYGVGNLYSLSCALKRMGVEPVIVPSLPKLGEADALILPGVGSFSSVAKTMSLMKEDFLELLNQGLQIFGICLGLQILFEKSEEGDGDGLGVIKGKVVRLPHFVKVPHMGWNDIKVLKPHPLTQGLDEEPWVYFVHSYYPVPKEKDVIIAEASYGKAFPVIISQKNIHGTQFHPEKSGKAGLVLLRNFVALCKK